MTWGGEETQHFVTWVADDVSHHAEVPAAGVPADPPATQGVSQASQPTTTTGDTGWGNSWRNLAGCCASVNVVFIYLFF